MNPEQLDVAPLVRRVVLTPPDAEEAGHVLTRVFTEGEPLSLALGIRYEEMKDFSRTVCEEAARAGLSVVAKNAEGQIVAFSISERGPAPVPEGLARAFPRMAPIFALLAGCEAKLAAAHAGDDAVPAG